MDARIAHADEAVKRLVATPEERELYRLRQKYERDKRSSEAYIEQKTWEKADVYYQGVISEVELRAEQEKKEMIEKQLKMIEFMLRAEIDIEVIVDTSGLTKAQVLHVQKKLKL